MAELKPVASPFVIVRPIRLIGPFAAFGFQGQNGESVTIAFAAVDPEEQSQVVNVLGGESDSADGASLTLTSDQFEVFADAVAAFQLELRRTAPSQPQQAASKNKKKKSRGPDAKPRKRRRAALGSMAQKAPAVAPDEREEIEAALGQAAQG
jgi:hypothetical protein